MIGYCLFVAVSFGIIPTGALLGPVASWRGWTTNVARAVVKGWMAHVILAILVISRGIMLGYTDDSGDHWMPPKVNSYREIWAVSMFSIGIAVNLLAWGMLATVCYFVDGMLRSRTRNGR